MAIQIESERVALTDRRGKTIEMEALDNDAIRVNADEGAQIMYEDMSELLTALSNFYNTGIFDLEA